jgi:hypothetical protein
VSGCGLDNWAIEIQSLAEAKGFLLASVSRLALGPTKPPVQWVLGFLSLGLKYGQGVTMTTYPYLVPRSRMSRSYTSPPPSAFMACTMTDQSFHTLYPPHLKNISNTQLLPCKNRGLKSLHYEAVSQMLIPELMV